MVISFLGPAGSGKDKQGEMVAEKLGVPLTGVGPIFRKAVEEGTAAGKEAEKYMDEGVLIPDDLLFRILEEELGKPEYKNGFVITSVPKGARQCRTFDKMLERLGTELDYVVVLYITKEEAQKRLMARWHCPKCLEDYNTIYMPPKEAGICDKDGEELIQRDDDKPEAIETRYRTQFEEIIDEVREFYKGTGKLKEIDGHPSIEDVRVAVWKELGISND